MSEWDLAERVARDRLDRAAYGLAVLTADETTWLPGGVGIVPVTDEMRADAAEEFRLRRREWLEADDRRRESGSRSADTVT